MSGSTTRHKAALATRAALCIFTAPLCILSATTPTNGSITRSGTFQRTCHFLRQLFIGRSTPILLAGLATLSVLASLDVADECRWTMSGPGLTFDENLNTAGGVYIVDSLISGGLGSLHPVTLHEIFNSPSYYPDYPPLGRIPLGLANAVLGRVLGLGEHPFYLMTYARVGSALCFGLTIWLIARFTTRHAGPLAGTLSGLCLWLTPRVFGHAHLASVETAMNLAYAGCAVVVVDTLAGKEKLSARDGLLPGCLLGLALLTKIQAIFLPPVIVLWLLRHWRLRAFWPLVVLALTSLVVFVLGWPWLWSDPLYRLWAYFAQTTNRTVLYCFYFGERFIDREVPWHYPFVMFLVTTPVPFLFLGGYGMWQSRIGADQTPSSNPGRLTRRQNDFLLGCFWLPLLVFAIPGVPVYDGERLFLIVWPIFSIWTGIAAANLWHRTEGRNSRALRLSLGAVAVLLPLVNIGLMHPCQLSYYNFAVGGLWGANRLGMERCYWGEAVTAPFLKSSSLDLPEGSSVGIAPILHPLLPRFMAEDSWLLHRPDLHVVAYDDQRPENPRAVILIHRRADPWTSLLPPPTGTQRLQQVTRQGVVLAEFLKLPESPSE